MDIRQAVRRAVPDIIAGTIFITFGVVFVVQSFSYELGTLLGMGPGYFPLILGSVLALLGLLVIGSGFVAEREETVETFPWRAMLFIPLAFILFGLTVRSLGLLPTLFITTLLAGLASTQTRLRVVLVIAAGLTVVSVLIFVVALRLQLQLLPPSLGLGI